MVKTISVKELRMNFPKIRKQLEEGVKFHIIYRSKPIAELGPILDFSKKDQLIDCNEKIYDGPKDLRDFLDNIDKYALKGGQPFDAVEEIRKDRGYYDNDE